jgi:hypothetical protein
MGLSPEGHGRIPAAADPMFFRMRSLSHSKELEPIPQFKATAKLGEFLEARFSESF